jgi:hypothetical protein
MTSFVSRRPKRFALTAIALGFLLLPGCGYPAAAEDNMELISALRTALSARNPKWLDENDAVIEKRHAAGQMGDDEYAAFKKIIERARSGEWQDAERSCMAFQRAQRPTPEQIERVRRREI